MPSFSSAQARRFSAQGAALSRAVNGQPAKYQGRDYTVALSAVTTRRQIEAGGFEVAPDFIARIDVAAYPAFNPVIGGELVVSGVAYKIVEIAKIVLGGELRIALAKA